MRAYQERGVGMRLRVLLLTLLGLTLVSSGTRATAPAPQLRRFTLDYTQSKFIAHAQRGGLLWFKGHEHLVAARVFTGEARLSPNQLVASSLQLTVKTDSMEE